VAGIARRRGSGGGGEAAGGRRKEGGEGRLTGGPRLSAAQGKKERERRWAGAGGRLGRLGRIGAGAVFLFFLFQTSFSNHVSTQIQFKLFQTFLKNFMNFLETTQATKNHASQLMMHNHLLSLGLLNYI
jgi:hypothetical protein